MRRILHAVTVLAVLSAATAQARQCKGVTFPEQLEVAGSTLALNGLGLRKATIFNVSVYVAALYVSRPSRDPRVLIESGAPSELILQFVRNVGASDIVEAWDKGFARNSPAQLPALKARIGRLDGWMADVKAGQRLSFVRRPGIGIQVEVNGTAKGTIEGDDFARTFLSIWLGAKPPNPALKDGLLGAACG